MFTPNNSNAPDQVDSASGKPENLKENRQQAQNTEPKPYNPYGRMRNPNRKVGCCVVKKNENEEITFSQFKTSSNHCLYRPLQNLNIDVSNTPSKTLTFSASTPNGTKMNSRRSININDTQLFFFSPKRKNTNTDTDHKTHKKSKKRLDFSDATLAFKGNDETSSTKGERETILLHDFGKLNRRGRGFKSQKTVMGKTAEQELIDFIENKKDKYSQDQLKVLRLLADSFKMEWLHRVAVSLSPTGFNPQVKENLGAGPKWINTLMMPLERLAAEVASKKCGEVSVESRFDMLPDSDLIQTIHYKVTIRQDAKACVISQSIPVLELPNRSNWPSTTDSTQLIQVVDCLLRNEKPV